MDLLIMWSKHPNTDVLIRWSKHPYLKPSVSRPIICTHNWRGGGDSFWEMAAWWIGSCGADAIWLESISYQLLIYVVVRNYPVSYHSQNKNFISVHIYSVRYIHIVYVYIYTGYLRGKKDNCISHFLSFHQEWFPIFVLTVYSLALNSQVQARVRVWAYLSTSR